METLSQPHASDRQPQPASPENPASLPGSTSFTERRRHDRSRIGRAATVSIDDSNAALLVNLGQGGMRVQALGRPLELGANIRLQFQLPGSPELISIPGAVAWVNDTAEAGIRFGGLSARLARRLEQWMAGNGIANAARELWKIAGGWPAAMDLMADLTRTLTRAQGVAVTFADRHSLYSSVDRERPVRSTVAAPIYGSQGTAAYLEISSPELGAFDETDLSALPVLAALVGELLQLRDAPAPVATRKPSALPARIVNRIESMIPTIRIRLAR